MLNADVRYRKGVLELLGETFVGVRGRDKRREHVA